MPLCAMYDTMYILCCSDVTVSVFGSSGSGFALKTSNLNLNIAIPGPPDNFVHINTHMYTSLYTLLLLRMFIHMHKHEYNDVA